MGTPAPSPQVVTWGTLQGGIYRVPIVNTLSGSGAAVLLSDVGISEFGRTSVP